MPRALRAKLAGVMTALWARLEPLLGQVQKPARYIGCEDGAVIPRHGPGRCRGCWRTPTPTRSACPTRASRSSTRSSTSGLTRSPSAPTRRGATSPPSCARSGVPLFSVDTHRAAGDFDLLAFNLSSELVFTQPPGDGRPRRGPRAGRRPPAMSTRSSSSAGTPRSTPSRSPTSSTPSCSARVRRSSARSPRSSAAWIRGGPRRSPRRAPRPRPGARRLRALAVRRDLRRTRRSSP